MSKQYSKKTLLEEFENKVEAKGFELNVKKGDGIARDTPTLIDFMEAMAEALSEILEDGDKDANLVASSFKIGPAGMQQPAAHKASPGQTNVVADITTDPQFFTWIETFHSLLQGVYPEPGNGSPNVFATALKALVSLKPTEIKAKITEGSDKVKISV